MSKDKIQLAKTAGKLEMSSRLCYFVAVIDAIVNITMSKVSIFTFVFFVAMLVFGFIAGSAARAVSKRLEDENDNEHEGSN